MDQDGPGGAVWDNLCVATRLDCSVWKHPLVQRHSDVSGEALETDLLKQVQSEDVVLVFVDPSSEARIYSQMYSRLKRYH